MVLKSFFDAGNQADSTQYDVVSLASVSGTSEQWRPFDEIGRPRSKSTMASYYRCYLAEEGAVYWGKRMG